MKDRKEYQKKYQKVYKRRNREKIEGYLIDYKIENAEKITKYNHNYYERNKEEKQNKKKEKKEDNKILEMIRVSREDHQGYVDIENEKRRENQRRYKQNRRQKIYNKYQGRCAYCGKKIKLENFDIEHMIYKREDRHFINTVSDNYSNLMPACKLCNRIKGRHDMGTFREKLFGRKSYKFHFER